MSPDTEVELIRALGRIEGSMSEIKAQSAATHVALKDLTHRVSKLELWQSWLKGAWAFGAACLAFVIKGIYGK
jgi:hypothetical protein